MDRSAVGEPSTEQLQREIVKILGESGVACAPDMAGRIPGVSSAEELMPTITRMLQLGVIKYGDLPDGQTARHPLQKTYSLI